MTSAIDGLREISSALRGYGIEEPYKEAEIVLNAVGIGKVALYRDNPVMSEIQMDELRRVLERRRRREPLQYVTGRVDFCGLNIKVGPGVLIPRPETELLAEETIKTVNGLKSKVSSQGIEDERQMTADCRLKILDLCTGSGCLALSIAKRFEDCDFVGIDISATALEYARENTMINGVGNVTFLRGDLFQPLTGDWFDIIVSNPPYIRSKEIHSLSPEIKDWEPLESIDGGEDGLRFYREVISQCPDYLFRGGSLILELGQGAAEDVVRIAEEAGFGKFSLIKDYAGIERVLHLTL